MHDYLLNLLRRDMFPSFYSDGMSSTVRAVALAALAAARKDRTARICCATSHTSKRMSLFGKAHYLMALNRISNTESLQDEVINMIRSHANETGGKVCVCRAPGLRLQTYPGILPCVLNVQC